MIISSFIVCVWQRLNLFSEDDSDDGEGDAANKRRSNPEAKGASKRIKIGMSESKALSMWSQQKRKVEKSILQLSYPSGSDMEFVKSWARVKVFLASGKIVKN